MNRRLTESEKIDARGALADLDGSGLSLRQAVAIALQRAGGAARRISPADAVEAFLASVARRGRRPATQRFYREQLEPWAMGCAAEHLDAVDRPALKKYLEAMAVAPGSARARHRAIRALYRWAMRQEPPLCGNDPTIGLHLELPQKAHAVEIFTPEEAGAMLHGAGPHTAAVALMLFAGIRPEELGGFGKGRVAWEHVDRVSRLIRVPAEAAKNGKARIIEGLPKTLWQWIRAARGVESESESGKGRKRIWSGPVLTVDWPTLRDRLKGALDCAWKHDGLRHSFATYMLAHNDDPGKVALWLGHEGAPTLLYRHYRGLATKAEAKRFLGLRPD